MSITWADDHMIHNIQKAITLTEKIKYQQKRPLRQTLEIMMTKRWQECQVLLTILQPCMNKPCCTYHAFLTLDHQTLVLVHATDTADDVIVFVDVVSMVAVHGIRAVCLTNRLADDLVDLHRSLVSCTVVRLTQPAHVSAHWRLPAVVFLYKTELNVRQEVWPSVTAKRNEPKCSGYTSNLLFRVSFQWQCCNLNTDLTFVPELCVVAKNTGILKRLESQKHSCIWAQIQRFFSPLFWVGLRPLNSTAVRLVFTYSWNLNESQLNWEFQSFSVWRYNAADTWELQLNLSR